MDFEEGGKVDNLNYITNNKISVNEVKLGTIMLDFHHPVRLAGWLCVCERYMVRHGMVMCMVTMEMLLLREHNGPCG